MVQKQTSLLKVGDVIDWPITYVCGTFKYWEVKEVHIDQNKASLFLVDLCRSGTLKHWEDFTPTQKVEVLSIGQVVLIKLKL